MTSARARPAAAPAIGDRVAALEWPRISAELDAVGWAATGPLLTHAECASLVDAYEDTSLYRSRVVMARHNFGSGEYRYYAYPLPDVVERLRRACYPHLAPLANRWAERLRWDMRYPDTLTGMLRLCAKAGQDRPTPLILRYAAGDYNCLHQDLYGSVHFPLQLAVLLDEPGEAFSGGELVLTEQRPRMQSRAHVVPMTRGAAVIFAVSQRPVRGTRGDYCVVMRHGVGMLRSGRRHALGVIFHDAA